MSVLTVADGAVVLAVADVVDCIRHITIISQSLTQKVPDLNLVDRRKYDGLIVLRLGKALRSVEVRREGLARLRNAISFPFSPGTMAASLMTKVACEVALDRVSILIIKSMKRNGDGSESDLVRSN